MGIQPSLRRRGTQLLVAALLLLCTWPLDLGEAAPDGSLAPPRLLTLRAQVLDRAPALDGDLDDWPALEEASRATLSRRAQLHPKLAEAWTGPEDASATVSLAVYGGDLYLGVEFRDDVIFHDPARSWWHGDSLEVFFDAGRPAAGPAASEFTEACRQLFLMPANPDLPWGVVYQGKRLTFDDGGLHGVEVARGEVQKNGTTAEMKIPLSNFGIGQEAGRIGVAFALNDADQGQDETGTYLSWNEGFDLYLHPDHFGVLEIPAAQHLQRPPQQQRPAPGGLSLPSSSASQPRC